MIAEPPFEVGADQESATEVVVSDPVARARGAPGTTAFEVYERFEGLVNEPLLVGVSVTVPLVVGVIVNVCGVADEEKVRTIGVERPPPLGVMVMVPV